MLRRRYCVGRWGAMAGGNRPRGRHERDEGEPVRFDPSGATARRLPGCAARAGRAAAHPQAFARAMAQWRRLPGAIGTTAAGLGSAAATSPPAAGEDGADDVP